MQSDDCIERVVVVGKVNPVRISAQALERTHAGIDESEIRNARTDVVASNSRCDGRIPDGGVLMDVIEKFFGASG